MRPGPRVWGSGTSQCQRAIPDHTSGPGEAHRKFTGTITKFIMCNVAKNAPGHRPPPASCTVGASVLHMQRVAASNSPTPTARRRNSSNLGWRPSPRMPLCVRTAGRCSLQRGRRAIFAAQEVTAAWDCPRGRSQTVSPCAERSSNAPMAGRASLSLCISLSLLTLLRP
jgi:hypothetical protein